MAVMCHRGPTAQRLLMEDKEQCFLIEAVSFGSDDAETILLKAVLLQVICLYQRVVPHVVTQCSFDFSKLLKGASQDVAPPAVCQRVKDVGRPSRALPGAREGRGQLGRRALLQPTGSYSDQYRSSSHPP